MRRILYQCQCTDCNSDDEPYNEFVWATSSQDAKKQLSEVLSSEDAEFWEFYKDDFEIMPVVDIHGNNILKEGE